MPIKKKIVTPEFPTQAQVINGLETENQDLLQKNEELKELCVMKDEQIEEIKAKHDKEIKYLSDKIATLETRLNASGSLATANTQLMKNIEDRDLKIKGMQDQINLLIDTQEKQAEALKAYNLTPKTTTPKGKEPQPRINPGNIKEMVKLSGLPNDIQSRIVESTR